MTTVNPNLKYRITNKLHNLLGDFYGYEGYIIKGDGSEISMIWVANGMSLSNDRGYDLVIRKVYGE